MSNQSVVITGIGHHHPTHKIENSFFDSLDIGSSGEWIEERTGIKSRYSVLNEDELTALRRGENDFFRMKQAGHIPSLASLSTVPWQMACARARQTEGFDPELLICGTSVPDFDIPANAATIARQLGLATPMVFDVNSACSSFITDLNVATSLLQTSERRSAAVFNVERYSLRLDYQDRRSCVLFGDGAAATLLQKSSPGDEPLHGLAVLDGIMHSDASGAELVQIPVMGHFSQIGARVQKFAISKTCEITSQLLARHGLHASEVSYFIGHQANLRMLQTCAQKLGFTPAQHLFNVDRFGNQGAAGAPCVLSQHWEQINTGDLVVVAVVGSGLSWGAALLKKV